ncbi:MAG: hypothetical protein DHS80DRAFT_22775 [Piptocephalis tieghemiana]|nr:MAG: hypothetical protein DHS80DRAFT_22775 [Piptocephalis tieghemiana]
MVRLQTKVRLGPGTLTLIPGYLSYEYFTQGYSLPSSQAPSSSLPSAWEQSWWRVGAWAAALCSPIACLLVLGALVVQILSLLHWCLASPIPPGDSDIPSAPTIPILPLIPGWTIPGYHTPVVLGALLTTALVHEAGHFLAARYASVPVRSFGLFLLLLFPGAFVRLDEESLSSQSSKTQWKIAAAGIWHNLLLLLLASLLLFAQWTDYLSVGLGAYRRIQDGVVVISVSSSSGLSSALPVGSIIRHIDDALITSVEDWSQRLQETPLRRKGYCLTLPDSPQTDPSPACCSIDREHPFGQSDNKTESCFMPHESSQSLVYPVYCLATHQVLGASRCFTSSQCLVPGTDCVIPSDPEPKGRVSILQYSPPLTDDTQDSACIYMGARADLFRSVEVYWLEPRFSWIPPWLPKQWELFLR